MTKGFGKWFLCLVAVVLLAAVACIGYFRAGNHPVSGPAVSANGQSGQPDKSSQAEAGATSQVPASNGTAVAAIPVPGGKGVAAAAQNLKDDRAVVRDLQGVLRVREMEVPHDLLAGDISKYRPGDRIDLELFDDVRLVCRLERVGRNVNGTAALSGKIEGEGVSHFATACTHGIFTAEFNFPRTGLDYAIYPRDGKYYVFEFLHSRRGALPNGNTVAPPPIPAGFRKNNPVAQGAAAADLPAGPAATPPLPAGDAVADTQVDVLVAYTPSAKSYADSNYGSISNAISLMMSKGQACLDNSNIGLLWNLTFSYQTAYTEQDSSQDLYNFTFSDSYDPWDYEGTPRYMEEVHTNRSAHMADVCVLLGNVSFTGGLGWLLDDTNGCIELAFHLARVQQVTWTSTEIHEGAHNMGSAHSKTQVVQPGTDGLYSYSSGWQWTNSPAPGGYTKGYCTVMTYEDFDSNYGNGQEFMRLDYFSNPSILITNGEVHAAGTVTDDNARSLRTIKSVVAAYYNPPGGTFTFAPVDYSIAEGGASVTVTVARTCQSVGTVSVQYATSNGTATAGSDYTATSGTLTWGDGDITGKTIVVSISGDSMYEEDETVNVVLKNPVGATIGTNMAVITILDNDTSPTVAFTRASRTSPSESGAMTVTAAVSAVSGRNVIVPFTLSGTAASPADYTITASPLTIPAGSASAAITITIVSDVIDEYDETVIVTMGTPTNALPGATLTHTATITDNDNPPSVQISDQALVEGNSGTSNVDFLVTLSRASGKTCTVEYATADGTAKQPADYTPVTWTAITFEPGTTGMNAVVSINGELLGEGDETFYVNLTNAVNVTIADAMGQGTIVDDDVALVVTSARGSPAPAAGTNIYALNSYVACTVGGSPVSEGTTQHVCLGWSGSGSVSPVGSTTNTGTLLLSQPSSITWNWKTQYWLDTTAGPGGTVNAADAWYNSASTAIVTATTNAGYDFAGWSGNTGGCTIATNRITCPMTQARAITASFVLKSYPITASAGANGSINPAGLVLVGHGSNMSFVASPASYYHISAFSVDGSSIGPVSSFTFTNVVRAHTTSVTFAEDVTTNAAVPLNWLAGYGMTNFEVDANLDQDNDGMSTWQEYLAGTDPTVTGSVFGVKTVQVVSNQVMVTWFGKPPDTVASRFRMYRCVNLQSNVWVAVDTNITKNPSGTNTWAMPVTNSGNVYFFKPAFGVNQ